MNRTAIIIGPRFRLLQSRPKCPWAARVPFPWKRVVAIDPIEDAGIQLEGKIRNQGLHGRTGKDDPFNFGVRTGPGGALVREIKWIIAMNRHYKILVFIG